MIVLEFVVNDVSTKPGAVASFMSIEPGYGNMRFSYYPVSLSRGHIAIRPISYVTTFKKKLP